MRKLFIVLSMVLGCQQHPQSDVQASAVFNQEFWNHWGDGKAEVAGYELKFKRYGEIRTGVAVVIFVTEPFVNSSRVKAESKKHLTSDIFNVMKLNLIRNFSTGIYDYNTMTSVFVGLEPFGGLKAGSIAKASFSSQEWCGHVYEQLRFFPREVEIDSHSYFDGEADQAFTLRRPLNGLSEDQLFHWARGLSAPFLDKGESVEIELLSSMLSSRFQHVPLSWRPAKLARSSDTYKVSVPSGEFNVRKMTVSSLHGTEWTFYVEEVSPHRIIEWSNSEKEQAVLLNSERLEYWKMNSSQFINDVKRLGLLPRSHRTP